MSRDFQHIGNIKITKIDYCEISLFGFRGKTIGKAILVFDIETKRLLSSKLPFQIRSKEHYSVINQINNFIYRYEQGFYDNYNKHIKKEKPNLGTVISVDDSDDYTNIKF